MDFEKELEGIANQYRDEGYAVVHHPNPGQLPAFAADFGVELLASRGKEHVLVQVKPNRAAVEADPNIPARAGLTNAQPGWQYDLVILNNDDPLRRILRDAGEPSSEQLEQILSEAETIANHGLFRAAFVLAWAGLEAAMRRKADVPIGQARWRASSPELLSQFYSSGLLSPEEFSRLNAAWRTRTEIVHGFMPAQFVDADLVRCVLAVARRLQVSGESMKAVAG
jgi:hypothetical protein